MENSKNTFDCETKDCAYNRNGECRFASFKNRPPHITEENGCIEGVIVVNNHGYGGSTHSVMEANREKVVSVRRRGHDGDPAYPGASAAAGG